MVLQDSRFGPDETREEMPAVGAHRHIRITDSGHSLVGRATDDRARLRDASLEDETQVEDAIAGQQARHADAAESDFRADAQARGWLSGECGTGQKCGESAEADGQAHAGTSI